MSLNPPFQDEQGVHLLMVEPLLELFELHTQVESLPLTGFSLCSTLLVGRSPGQFLSHLPHR
jgi:hypothetical protein